jgi:putative ABC transport system substrate-binding protein
VNRRTFVTGLGAVLAAPLGVEAQQTGKIPRVGFLSSGNRVPPDHPYLGAIRDGLQDAGYVVGQSIVVDWEFAENDHDRLPALVARMIRSHVDVFLCVTSADVIAAKNATNTIPIVMLGIGDPVGVGFVQSLAHPGGNITGLSPNHHELGPKRLQLLREIVQKTSRIGVLSAKANAGAVLQLRVLERAAQSLGLELYVPTVDDLDSLARAFKAFIQRRVESVVIIPDPFTWDYRMHLGALAIDARLPTMGQDRQFVEAGILMTYGVNEVVFWRRAGTFIDRILKGVKPADIPVEQPTTFELVINLKTAKALGLTIPPSLLRRADQVIDP